MTINEYQKLAMTTLNRELDDKNILANGVMGLCGESGEACDIVKKHIFQGHDLNREHLIEELGDVAWYLAELATVLNIDLEDVLSANIAKLKARYPEGFDSEKSINRFDGNASSSNESNTNESNTDGQSNAESNIAEAGNSEMNIGNASNVGNDAESYFEELEEEFRRQVMGC